MKNSFLLLFILALAFKSFAQKFESNYSIDLKYSSGSSVDSSAFTMYQELMLNPIRSKILEGLISDFTIERIDAKVQMNSIMDLSKIIESLYNRSTQDFFTTYDSDFYNRLNGIHPILTDSVLNRTISLLKPDTIAGEMIMSTYTEKIKLEDIGEFDQYQNWLFNDRENKLYVKTYAVGFSMYQRYDDRKYKGRKALYYINLDGNPKEYYGSNELYYGITDQEVLNPVYTWIRNIHLPVQNPLCRDTAIYGAYTEWSNPVYQVKQIKNNSLPDILFHKFKSGQIKGYTPSGIEIKKENISSYGAEKYIFNRADEVTGEMVFVEEMSDFDTNRILNYSFDISMTTELKNNMLINEVQEITIFKDYEYNENGKFRKTRIPFLKFKF